MLLRNYLTHLDPGPLEEPGSSITRERTLMMLLVFATIAVIGYLDQLTGPELSVTALYLIPVAVAAGYLGTAAGRVTGVAAGAASVMADLLDARIAHAPLVVTWNAAMIIVLSMVIVEVLSRLRSAINAQYALARTDALTGLPNVRSFDEIAGLEVERSRRYHRVFTLAVLDLDNFKQVNDTMGHHAGDELIRDVGRALREGLRKVDIVARLGGDEFVLLMPETDENQAQVALSHVRIALKALDGPYGSEVRASIGTVTFTAAPDTVSEMVRTADTAMYRAKTAGRDRVESVTVASSASYLASGAVAPMREFGVLKRA